MKLTFAFTMPVMVAVTAAVGALANTQTTLVEGASPKTPKLGAATSQGCYSTASNMTAAHVDTLFLSSGSCVSACVGRNYAVAALSPQDCYCGNTYPPKDNVVDLAKCNFPCTGFAAEACGGLKNAFSIFNTGINLAPENDGDSSSSSSASSSSTDTSSAPSASSSASSSNSSSSTSTSASADNAKTSSATSAATSAAPTESKASPTPAKSNGANTDSTAFSIVIGAVAAAIIGGII